MSTTVETGTAIRPFHVEFAEEQIDDLRRRIAATRWPTKELVDDRSQGVQLAAMQALTHYWLNEYDFGRIEARLNALPQFVTEIDGVDIHFIHVRSSHENALPLVITHGWPGSVIEMLDVIEPLTDPTTHGGKPEDAFDLVVPSLPGYGLSSKPTEIGWIPPVRVAKAWAELMRRLGYAEYAAQGGARRADRHPHEPVLPGAGRPDADGHGGGEGSGRADRDVQGRRLRLLPRASHAAADDRLRPAGLACRARSLVGRPRHRRVLQDRLGLRRRQAVGQPHA
jgi:hypothetical protein